MNKQKLIEYCEYLKGDLNKFINGIDVNKIIKMIEQLDEPQKVMIPQFVADWITKAKTEGLKRKNSLGSYEELFPSDSAYSAMFSIFIKGFAIGEVRNWVAENTDTFALAWINGYDVEEEKRYLVKVKGVNDYGCYLNKGLLSKEYFWESKAEIGGRRTKHTRKQLEDDDFGWVFDCEGIEIEEVENE